MLKRKILVKIDISQIYETVLRFYNEYMLKIETTMHRLRTKKLNSSENLMLVTKNRHRKSDKHQKNPVIATKAKEKK